MQPSQILRRPPPCAHWINGFSPSANLPSGRNRHRPEVVSRASAGKHAAREFAVAHVIQLSARRGVSGSRPVGIARAEFRAPTTLTPRQAASPAPALRGNSHDFRYSAPRLSECRRHSRRLSPQRTAHLRHVDRQRPEPRHDFTADRHAAALHPNQHAKNGLRNRKRALRLENALRRPSGNPIRNHANADNAPADALAPSPVVTVSVRGTATLGCALPLTCQSGCASRIAEERGARSSRSKSRPATSTSRANCDFLSLPVLHFTNPSASPQPARFAFKKKQLASDLDSLI